MIVCAGASLCVCVCVCVCVRFTNTFIIIIYYYYSVPLNGDHKFWCISSTADCVMFRLLDMG